MEPITLTVADLVSLRNVVEAATKRGAFNASELSSVGSIYDKLNSFIIAAEQQLQSSESDQPQAQGEQNA